MRVGFAAFGLALVVGLLPLASSAQTAAEYYWWKAAEHAQRGELPQAREDLLHAVREVTDPDTTFAIQGKLLDIDIALAFNEYAQRLRGSNQAPEAAAVEEHVTRYLKAMFGGGDRYLGFDPAELLRLYAAYLRSVGSASDATRIDVLLVRYEQAQAEQFRRVQQRQR